MGFVWQGETFRLRFSAAQMRGFEVDVGSVTPDQYATLAKLARQVEPKAGELPSEEMLDAFLELCDRFGEALHSWNLQTPNGDAVPTTELRKQDVVLVMAVVRAWLDAVADYGQRLADRAQESTELEAGMPMETTAGV